MAYAPSAMRSAATAITGSIGGAVFSGIVGDAAHLYGYHLARNQLPGSDYSVQLAADRDGNGDAASALDISLPPAEMIAVTARLRAAAKAGDPRLYALREFAGTLDGRTTFNRDLSSGGEGFGNWDDSHLWHVHLSGYRRYADDPDAWRAIADVFTDTASIGGALSEEDELMAAAEDIIKGVVDRLYPEIKHVQASIDGSGAGDDYSTKQAVMPILQRMLGSVELTNSAAGQLLGRPVGQPGGDVDEAEVARLVIQMLGPDLAARVAPLLTVVAK